MGEEKAGTNEEYAKAIVRVRKLRDLTATAAWRDLYRWLVTEIDGHAAAVLEAEKTREVVRHQEGAKILRGIIEHIQSPIHELNAVIDATPLFLPKDYQAGLWDAETGDALLVAKDDPRLKKAKKPAAPAKGKKAKKGKAKAAKGE